jgi:hypothetical protein
MERTSKGTFRKGSVPWNKGKKGIHLSKGSEFKKGELVGVKHPSCNGVEQVDKHDCVYLWSGANKRSRRPRLVYEENFGPIPEGYVIIHIDGNRYNDDPSNLMAISRAENLKRNSKK